MAVDPVCYLEVDKKMAKFKSVYKGKTYSFCALGYKITFEENHKKYVKR